MPSAAYNNELASIYICFYILLLSKIVLGKLGGMCSNQANWVICTMSIKETFVTSVTFFGGKEITGHKLYLLTSLRF